MLAHLEEKLVHVDGYVRTRYGKPQYVDAHVRGSGGRARVGDRVLGITPDGDKVEGILSTGPDKEVYVDGARIADIRAVDPVPREKRSLPAPEGPPDPTRLRQDLLKQVVQRLPGDRPGPTGTIREREYARALTRYVTGLNEDGTSYQSSFPPHATQYGIHRGNRNLARAGEINKRVRSIMQRHGVDQPLGHTGFGVVTAQGRVTSRLGDRNRRPGIGFPEAPEGPEHDAIPPLPEAIRRYKGHGATFSKPAPRMVRDLRVWERVAAEHNAVNGRTYTQWTEQDRKTALAKYRREKKLPASVPDTEELRNVDEADVLERALNATSPEKARRMYREIAERDDPDAIARRFPGRRGPRQIADLIEDAEARGAVEAAVVLERAYARRVITHGSQADRRRALKLLTDRDDIPAMPYIQALSELEDKDLLHAYTGPMRRELADTVRERGGAELADRVERLSGTKPPLRPRRKPRTKAQQLAQEQVKRYLDRDGEVDIRALENLGLFPDRRLRQDFNNKQLHILGAMAEENGAEILADRFRALAGMREQASRLRSATGRVRDFRRLNDGELAAVVQDPGARGYGWDPEGFDALALEMERRNWGRPVYAVWPGREFRFNRKGDKALRAATQIASEIPASRKPYRISEQPLTPEEAANFRRVDLAEVRTAFFGRMPGHRAKN